MNNRRNYYRMLHLQPDCPDGMIKASYRALMLKLKYHPDLGGDTATAAMINEAYRVLSDPHLRSEYDKKLFASSVIQKHSQGRAGRGQDEEPDASPDNSSSNNEAEQRAKCSPAGAAAYQQANIDDTQDDEAVEKRGIERMEKTGLVNYSVGSHRTMSKGVMSDLSPKGMRMLVVEQLDAGMQITIETELFRAVGEVRNAVPTVQDGASILALGILFRSITFFDRKSNFISTYA